GADLGVAGEPVNDCQSPRCDRRRVRITTIVEVNRDLTGVSQDEADAIRLASAVRPEGLGEGAPGPGAGRRCFEVRTGGHVGNLVETSALAWATLPHDPPAVWQ